VRADEGERGIGPLLVGAVESGGEGIQVMVVQAHGCGSVRRPQWMDGDSQVLMVRAANGFGDFGEFFRRHNLSQGQSKAASWRITGSDYVTD
jgi:hypothetical protein